MSGKYVPYIEVEILRNMEMGYNYDAIKDINELIHETENIKAADYIATLKQMVDAGKISVVSGGINGNFIRGLRITLTKDPRLDSTGLSEPTVNNNVEPVKEETKHNGCEIDVIERKGNKILIEYKNGEERGEREWIRIQ